MPGRTFSDYSTDVHITPIATGGIDPMEYIDVVVNIGSLAAGNAEAPKLLIDISNQFPALGEFVEMSVRSGRPQYFRLRLCMVCQRGSPDR